MKKDKIWPITLTIILASTIISSMIFIYYSKNLNYDLVTKEYYEEGLKYQNQINRIARSNDPSIKPTLKVLQDIGIILTFPQDSAERKITGYIIFYRPSDASQDIRLPIEIYEDNQQIISTQNLSKGNWKIKIFWYRDNIEYYFEDRLYL